MSNFKDLDSTHLIDNDFYHKETSLSERVQCDNFMDQQFGSPKDITDPEVKKAFEEVYSTALKKNFRQSSSDKKFFI